MKKIVGREERTRFYTYRQTDIFVQPLSHVWLFATTWTAGRQASCPSLFPRVCSNSWHPTPVLLPGKTHGWRSLVGCSSWGHEESYMTEWLHFHFSLSCTGEGNGSPFQCSCLENPRDSRAWWAAIYGVAQSQIRLKWLSSGSMSIERICHPTISFCVTHFSSCPLSFPA